MCDLLNYDKLIKSFFVQSNVLNSMHTSARKLSNVLDRVGAPTARADGGDGAVFSVSRGT